ncbi:hypothetical protein D5b_00336 [Faustovirus]|nr:hypothetical protein D5b_00336 [Faustovirus]AMN84577.1 hypothetical protein D6_00171 [Faustovirus]AMP44281.1 hypothetical protein PRJ_Dakar_00328 [Faustovirus]QKE50276.1 hypothetical protein F-VV10_0156 [Faustovirus]
MTCNKRTIQIYLAVCLLALGFAFVITCAAFEFPIGVYIGMTVMLTALILMTAAARLNHDDSEWHEKIYQQYP